MTENEKGQIAIKRFRQNPYRVYVPPDRHYIFTPNKGVCLGWVDPEDVQAVLDTLRHCCGNSKVRQFYLANEEDVRIHGG